jgi:prepilin-type N-terminal cleavage/methylation domain-containing protein
MRRRSLIAAPESETGFTLVELLVTVTIMAISFIAIMSALLVFLRGTVTHRATAELDQAMRTYVEQLADQPYVNCAPTYSLAAPSGFTKSISVAYWNGNSSGTTFTAGPCTSDKGVQKLTVTLTRTANGQTDTLVVVKRSA